MIGDGAIDGIILGMENSELKPVDHSVIAPYSEVEFKRMGVLDVWERYEGRLSWGKGQTIAMIDDGCDIDVPEWRAVLPWGPKVVASWNVFEENDNPRPVPPGYHGTSVGYPSSLNYQGKRGVAYNDFVVHIRAITIVHLPGIESETVAKALKWVIANQAKYNITAVNLAPVDDLRHGAALETEIDGPVRELKKLNVWVSAPCGNNQYTDGISWPACSPEVFAIGGVKPEEDRVHLDRCGLVDLVVPARATSSSNAFICGAALILREAIEKTGFDWRKRGATLPEAIMAIFKETGVKVLDPATGLTFPRLDLLAAVESVMGR
jgi:hypothetical protein